MLIIIIKKKQCIAIIYYKSKLSLFGRGDTKQTKGLIFIVVSQAEQVSIVQKAPKEMLLEPIICYYY